MILDSLKEQTRQQHAQLEQLNALPLDVPSYVTLLENFHGFIVPWEERLAGTIPADDPLRLGREKSSWLAADLAHFGCTAVDRSELPRCVDLPSVASRAELVGACYVIEGSTLGGQFITRHLEAALGLANGAGCRYFRSYGAEVGAKWQAFRQEILRHSSPANDPLIVRAAQETFEKLAAWFAARRLVTT